MNLFLQKCLFITCVLICHPVLTRQTIAQTGNYPWSGEYYLEGVRETASGFKINPDSSFEFFFSSGALDRYGSGKVSIQKNSENRNMVFFNSTTHPGPALKIADAEKKGTKGISIHITEANAVLNRFFYAVGFSGNDSSFAESDQDGIIALGNSRFDSIRVYFEFCPDHVLIFVPEDKKNYYKIKTEAWLFEIFFRDFHLQVEKDRLIGQHPLIPGDYIYMKNDEY